MVKFTKKGTPVKNNSYKYGMICEKYISRRLKCPRCNSALRRQKANTPGTDFVCKNNHYFQLKSKEKKSYSETSKSKFKLSCGSYEHQKEALSKPKCTDFLFFLYNKSKHEAHKLFWLKNEKIHGYHLKPKKVSRKSYRKDEEGNKIYNDPKDYILSTVECDKMDLEEIPLDNINKSLNVSVKREKPSPYKDVVVNVQSSNGGKHFLRSTGHKVNLSKFTCTCKQFTYNNTYCKHIYDAMNAWRANDLGKFFVKSKDNIYLVDAEEKTCTCPHYTFRKSVCKHIKQCCHEINDKNLKVFTNSRSIK